MLIKGSKIPLRICVAFIVQLLFFAGEASAQSDFYQLQISIVEGKELPKKVKYKEEIKDSIGVRRELNQLVLALQQLTFITASIDSVKYDDKNVYAYIFLGEQYKWASLSKGNVDDELLGKIGFREKFYQNKPFSYREFVRLQKKVIAYSNNNGFPFAQIKLDSIDIEKGEVRGALRYTPGPEIIFDSLVIKGTSKVHPRFLGRYLKIKPGAPFDQSKLDDIPRRLKLLPYLSVKQQSEVVFRRNKAVVYLFINEKKANQFDGILGILPNEEQEGKILVTGEVNVGLRNFFGTGKSFLAEWKKIEKNTQTLDIKYIHPELFGSNIDLQADFNLLKQDTTFISLDRQLMLSSDIGKIGIVGFFVSFNTSRLLNTAGFATATVLPEVSDYDYLTYGINYTWQNLDDQFFPKRGAKIFFQTGIGNKTIRKSSVLPETLYENVDLKTAQLIFFGYIEKHFRLGKKSVFFTKASAGIVENENLFVNDLFRLGGLKSIRGFNENFFFANRYTALNLEYRFFTSSTSFLFLFTDQGYIWNKLSTNKENYIAGLGAGISFDTRVGVFNLVYSLGMSDEQQLSFNLSKIHFGLVTRF